MKERAFQDRLKELREHLIARKDERGLALLKRALDTLHPRALADVSEDELMGFLHSIEEIESSADAAEWVSISAVRTEVGLLTRGMIESEISRRFRDLPSNI